MVIAERKKRTKVRSMGDTDRASKIPMAHDVAYPVVKHAVAKGLAGQHRLVPKVPIMP